MTLFDIALLDSTSTMAYNREWDQGKASWGQQQSWNATNVHPRDEDYYTEGKRRKMNAGVSHSLFSPILPSSISSRVTKPRMHTQRMHTIPRRIRVAPTHPRSEAPADLLSKSACSHRSRAPMSFSWVWIPTSPRPMSVDSLLFIPSLPCD
jgi:hypothetical protein